ncbi:MAG TPA: M3 family oligoendopeptidase [Candidatus Sulfotelmatobacter sp.]|nr:M3 family oligoendopeptidase [Candidatus Sulfotelmatobacter sp.]
MNDVVAKIGALPQWDLADLYPGMASAELERDLAEAQKTAEAFAARYQGKLAALDGAALGDAIAEYERLEDRLGRIMSFAHLTYAGDMTDPAIGKFFQTMQEKINAITTHTLFVTLEINRIEEAALADKLKAPALARYAPWLRDVRVFRPHQLSDEIEKLLHEKSVAGRSAWVRLFDETVAGLVVPVEGENLGVEQALHLLSDANAARRKAAAKALGAVFGGNVRLFALVMNTLAKDKEVEDKWRHLPTPAASRHLGNHVEPEVVGALTAAVRNAYPRLSHRYYALKARWMGQDKLEYWDRNAPLPEAEDRVIPWSEARETVLKAYGRFSPELAAIGKRFFDHAWIDAPARAGKAPGAFAHPTVPSAHPYLLLNYQGKTRDVMTLAHELGHGVHQVLAAAQGALMADTPLTLAETASVFGEQLTFRALLAAEKTPQRRRVMLASKVEDMLNTVVRQIAFYEFERRVHDERAQGELTPERIGELWLAVQSESLGPSFHFDAEYQYYWTYISHFIHSPFYVYAYAFGDCLVNALYAVYQDAEKGFQEKYLAMLKAGGTLRHRELLAPFGLDATDPGFWGKGLGVIEGFIDQLEAVT